MAKKSQCYDVFISYAQSRRRLTAKLAKDLEAAGFSTWWDAGVLAGDDFLEDIERQLQHCKAAVIIWTEESTRSAWVRSEANHALRLNKLINTHDRGVKPDQIPKPFDQFHSVKLSDRAAIIEAIKKRIEGDKKKVPFAKNRTPIQTRGKSTTPGDKLAPKARSTAQGAGPLPKSRAQASRPWLFAGMFVVALLAGLEGDRVGLRDGPEWTFEKKPFFLNEAIPLAWRYARSPDTPICFEVESARDEEFRSDRVPWTCTDANDYYAKANGTLYWRVRAANSETRTPLSKWSEAIKVTRYDDAYERIKETGKVRVYVSTPQDQDIFKFVTQDIQNIQGLDVKLTDLIVKSLQDQMNIPLKREFRSVAWGIELLRQAGEGEADFIISSITHTKERERENGIAFTVGYFCTGHSLIYPVDTPDGSILHLIAGKKVGVQDQTTNASLAKALANGNLFEVVIFPTTEALRNALLAARMAPRIDFAIADTSFARAVQLSTRLGRNQSSERERVHGR